MKRLFPAALTIILVFSACNLTVNSDGPDDNDNDPTDNETTVIFDNASNAKVKVYSTQTREGQPLTEVPALKNSEKIPYPPVDSANFFITYSLVFADIPIDYIPPNALGQLSQRIDEGKTTEFLIPELAKRVPGETETAKNQYKLSNDTYLMIKNSSGDGIRLKRGNGLKKPETIKDGQGVTKPNSGGISQINRQELAIYKITAENPGELISNYKIEYTGISVDKDLSIFGIETFETGTIYSLVCEEFDVGSPKTIGINLANYIPAKNDVLTAPAVTALAISNSSIQLSWEYVSGAMEYRVYRSDTAGGNYMVIDTISGNAYTVEGLSAATTYYFKVCGVNALGEDGPLSSSVSAKTLNSDSTAIILQNNVWYDASILSGTAQYYKFNAAAGTTYKINWNDYYNGSGSQTGDIVVSAYMGSGYYFTLSDSAYTIPMAITPDTSGEVILKVEPYRSNRYGSYAIKYEGTVPAPGQVRVTAGEPKTLTVQWAAVAGASVYEVWVGTSNTSDLAAKHGGDINGLSAEIDGLINGTTYYVWVKAKNSIGETSSFSTRADGKPIGPPETPERPVVTPGTNKLMVSWTSVPGADKYEVYYGASSPPPTLWATVSGTSTVITELSNGKRYYAMIRAKNSTGPSGWSGIVSGIPAPGAVSIAIGFNYGQISISGSDDSNAISRSGNKGPESLNLSVSGYDEVVWYVDGDSTKKINGSETTLAATDYPVRFHSITFTGTKNGVLYSREIPFTVYD
jgi:fibronectin type 3 domain-containing protein